MEGAIYRNHVDSLFKTKEGIRVGRPLDAFGLAFDVETEWVYAVIPDSGTVERVRRDGSGDQVLLGDLDRPEDVALDLQANQMVWIESGSGTVWRSALDGTDKEQLFSGLTDPQYVAVAGAKAVAAPLPEDARELPTNLTLHQNYPNPFNPSTRIVYELPRATNVRLTIFDLLGRRVRTLVDSRQAPDRHAVQFDGSGLPSGLYFYRLQAGPVTRTRTMTLVK